MRNLKGGELAVDELLEKWPIKGWCQAYFNDVVEVENIDNNMCETFNGMLLQAKSKPIILMLEEMRQYVMNRVFLKRESTAKWKLDYGPNIISKIDKERNKG